MELTAERARIFRITHIDNVPWILAHGLHCGSSDIRDPAFVQIGHPEIIGKRATRAISTPPGGTLHDYIPFYFTPYSPMLYNIKTGYGVAQRPMRDIVILVAALRDLAQNGVSVLIADRHAYLVHAQFSPDLSGLDWIDWTNLQARNFKKDPNDLSKFERYQAEALVYQHLPLERLSGVVCHGAPEEERIQGMVQDTGVACSVAARPTWYL
jgi:ssDNA thymidine ADP-ribosyltransferase, DarT